MKNKSRGLDPNQLALIRIERASLAKGRQWLAQLLTLSAFLLAVYASTLHP